MPGEIKMSRPSWLRRAQRPSPSSASSSEPLRELAVRVVDDLRVVMSWRPSRDDVVVSVDDQRTGERFRLEVAGERAMHAFHHPFAYVALEPAR
jgi:hypothetical protein